MLATNPPPMTSFRESFFYLKRASQKHFVPQFLWSNVRPGAQCQGKAGTSRGQHRWVPAPSTPGSHPKAPQLCCPTLAGAGHHLPAIIYVQSGNCLEDRSNCSATLPIPPGHQAHVPALGKEMQPGQPSRDRARGTGAPWFCASALCWRQHLVQAGGPEHSTYLILLPGLTSERQL